MDDCSSFVECHTHKPFRLPSFLLTIAWAENGYGKASDNQQCQNHHPQWSRDYARRANKSPNANPLDDQRVEPVRLQLTPARVFFKSAPRFLHLPVIVHHFATHNDLLSCAQTTSR